MTVKITKLPHVRALFYGRASLLFKDQILIAVVVSFQVCAVQLLVQVPIPVLDISAQLQILLHLHSRLSGKLARFDG